MKIQEESSNSQTLTCDRTDCLIVDFLVLLLRSLIDSVRLKTEFSCLSNKYANYPDADDSERPPQDLLEQSDK